MITIIQEDKVQYVTENSVRRLSHDRKRGIVNIVYIDGLEFTCYDVLEVRFN